MHTYEGDVSLPPAYADSEDTPAREDNEPSFSYLASGATGSFKAPTIRPNKTRDIITLHPAYSKEPNTLYELILDMAIGPPRPIIRFKGVHAEQQRGGDGKTNTNNVTDFDVQVDCTHVFDSRRRYYRSQPANSTAKPWYHLEIPHDENKALRGGIVESVVRKRPIQLGDDVEAPQLSNSDDDTLAKLRNYTHIYCAAAQRRWPMTFRFRKTMTAWNTNIISKNLEAMVRATKYRGSTEISYRYEDAGVIFMSDHWMNRLRSNPWVFWLCIILQLWIITWPILWLCTGKFDVICATWPYRQMQRVNDNDEMVYAGPTEREWLDTWGKTIAEKAFAKHQGWVDHDDVRASQRATEQMVGYDWNAAAGGSSGSSQGPDFNVHTGNGAVDTAVGVLAAMAGARNGDDRSQGWGENAGGGSGGSRSKTSLTVGGFSANF